MPEQGSVPVRRSVRPDEAALRHRAEQVQAKDVGYLDYVEIVNAIEALGGERPSEREFSGDPYYESLKHV